MTTSSRIPFVAGIGIAFLLASPSTAQCSQWLPGSGVAGVDGDVFAMVVWDPDGSGPLGEHVVLGGGFRTPVADNLVLLDPVTGTFSALGGNPDHWVTELSVSPTGVLVAGGSFNAIGVSTPGGIAQWNGSTWSSLGGGVLPTINPVWWPAVMGMCHLPNGDLVVAGSITHAGGVPCDNIARWDGTSWSPLGPGLPGSWVTALTVAPNGDVVAGGSFTAAGGTADNLARWNGSTWGPVGNSVSVLGTTSVHAFAWRANELLIAGWFASMPNALVVGWNGTSWSVVASAAMGGIQAMLVSSGGSLFVGCEVASIGGVSVNYIAQWNGSAWSSPGGGIAVEYGSNHYPGVVRCLVELSNGELLAAGGFERAGSAQARSIARWNGTEWSGFGMPSPHVYAMTTAPNGDVISGGAFEAIAGVPARNLARWNGTTWAQLGGGLDGCVTAVLALPNGDIVAAGAFRKAGGVHARGIARWNGATWAPLGTGVGQYWIAALAVLPNGDIVAGGLFREAGGVPVDSIARFDGTGWHALGAGVGGIHLPMVAALCVLPNGDLIVGGRFRRAGDLSAASIARWDGVAWWPLGSGVSTSSIPNPDVMAILRLDDGSLAVSGPFSVSTAGGAPCHGLARWDGTNWSSMGQTGGGRMTRLADGDLVVARWGWNGGSLERWNGVSWSSEPVVGGGVSALASRPNGELVVGGSFTQVGGLVSAGVAHRVSTCPPAALPTGSGCAGQSLATTTLPWLGGTLHATASGLSAGSLALAMIGVSYTNLPLPAPALPGCALLVWPELTHVQAPVAGSVDIAVAIPDNVVLLGQTLHMQVLGLTFAGTGLTAVASTNALALTIGAL